MYTRDLQGKVCLRVATVLRKHGVQSLVQVVLKLRCSQLTEVILKDHFLVQILERTRIIQGFNTK